MAYRVDFTCHDDDPLQQLLNDLYAYRDDIATKVLHRCRLNLFWLLLGELKTGGKLEKLGSAIDIGCNAGMYSGILSDCGFRRVLGIDIDEGMIAKAQRTFGSSQPGKSVEFRLQRAEDILEVMQEAVQKATTGRYGPVFVALPTDLHLAEVDVPAVKGKKRRRVRSQM